jgi:hypothetical protein
VSDVVDFQSDYANFSGKFALAANRGQLTG